MVKENGQPKYLNRVSASEYLGVEYAVVDVLRDLGYLTVQETLTGYSKYSFEEVQNLLPRLPEIIKEHNIEDPYGRGPVTANDVQVAEQMIAKAMAL